MIARWRVAVAILLMAAGALVSGLLLLEHHGEQRAVAAVSQVCGEGDQSGCAVVSQSRYDFKKVRMPSGSRTYKVELINYQRHRLVGMALRQNDGR